MKTPLSPEEADALTFQNYEAAPEIDGVSYTPLKKHQALEGWFMEYMRISDGKIENLPDGFKVRQVSLAKAAPNRINAFHVHPKRIQDEIWCVVDGVMMVWLIDTRANSPTRGARKQYILSAESPGMLFIPTGVAHGYKSGPAGALLAYAMNSQFDISDPNEGRLAWDHFGADLWEDDRG